MSLYSLSDPQMLEFLAQEVPKTSSYSSVNTIRSAISLISSSKKLALLLALGTNHRTQTFRAIKISQMSLNEKPIIHIPNRIKTSASRRRQSFFYFSRFNNHKNLCLMEHYLSMTRELHPPSYDSLFISFTMPHKAIISQIIDRWIKQSLEECGVDTTMFTVHSTRLDLTLQKEAFC
ncbi:hypothetical protein ALC56_06347 [Trachymyrmex septentrionalis]|uniref:Tyr recombinase domain-containing protein n=1 Tax=Trachymyrmex septentrionalis TaxID=34720 RepID=A0A195FF10_9HYME|nr:hypothetical protein ALC56_06347 [Trachymyrmex septentrionalis]